MTIYPQVEIGGAQKLYTNVRKNFNGTWYLISVLKQSLGVPIEIALAQFHRDAYACLVCSEYTSELRGMDGSPIFRKDDNQEDEKQRLLKQLKPR